MNAHEVPEPILNSPFEEPSEHWWITEHEPPERRSGRRPAMYYYRRPGSEPSLEQQGAGTAIELKLVSRVRAKLAEWRPLALRGEGGVTRTTMELLRYWRQDGRKHRLFFAQIEAVETIIFLTEARPDFLQGIRVPMDEPGEEARAGRHPGLPPLRLQDGNGHGQDHRHGHAGFLEHSQQGGCPGRCPLFGCGVDRLSQHHHPQPGSRS